MIEVVLKIYLHCESCAEEVKHCILKMEGVLLLSTCNPFHYTSSGLQNLAADKKKKKKNCPNSLLPCYKDVHIQS